MLTPGIYWPNTTIDLDIVFTDEAGANVDPVTVVLRLMDQWGSEKKYTYGSSSNLTKSATGVYSCAVLPDKPGRWSFRWEGTGTNTTVGQEGVFNVRSSIFWENNSWRDYA